MVDEPNSTSRQDDSAGGRRAGVVALLRVASILVDPEGRIAGWNRAAEELFGHRAEVACGRTASGLLPAIEPRPETADPAPPGTGRRCDAFDTLDDLTQPDTAWAGTMAVIDREERLKDVLWWAYPLLEPGGRSLLALAADARPLRSSGPRIALGERLVPYAAAPAAGSARPHRVAAALGPAAADPAAPAALAAMLPIGSDERRQRLLAQVGAAGLPAIWVDSATRLPVMPYQSAGTGTARLVAGIGRRYPTPQQRVAQPRATGRPPEPSRPSAGLAGAGSDIELVTAHSDAAPGGVGSTIPGPREAVPAQTDGPTLGGTAIESAANGHPAAEPLVDGFTPPTDGPAHIDVPAPAAPPEGFAVLRGALRATSSRC